MLPLCLLTAFAGPCLTAACRCRALPCPGWRRPSVAAVVSADGVCRSLPLQSAVNPTPVPRMAEASVAAVVSADGVCRSLPHGCVPLQSAPVPRMAEASVVSADGVCRSLPLQSAVKSHSRAQDGGGICCCRCVCRRRLQVPASRLRAVAERFRAQDGGGHLLLPLCLLTAFAGPCLTAACRCRALPCPGWRRPSVAAVVSADGVCRSLPHGCLPLQSASVPRMAEAICCCRCVC